MANTRTEAGRFMSGKSYSPATQFKPGQHPAPATEIQPGQRLSPATEFKPGMDAHNRLPVGAVRVRRETHTGLDCAWVKTAEPNVWRKRAVIVWEAEHGPVARGLGIHHRDRDSLNDALANLHALTRKEHADEHRGELEAARVRNGTNFTHEHESDVKLFLIHFGESSLCTNDVKGLRYQCMREFQTLCALQGRLLKKSFIISKYVISGQGIRHSLNYSECRVQFVGATIWKYDQGMQFLRRPCANGSDRFTDFFQLLIADRLNPNKWRQAGRMLVEQLAKGADHRVGVAKRQLNPCSSKSGQLVGIFVPANIFPGRQPNSGSNSADRSDCLNPVRPFRLIEVSIQPRSDQSAGQADGEQRVSDNSCFEVVDCNCHKEILA